MRLFGRARRRRVYRQLAFINLGEMSFFAGFALIIATVVGGSGYLIRELHHQVVNASSAAGLPASIVPNLPPIVSADMLHVSSVALGRTPIAVVNGTFVSEGQSIQLQTPEGSAVLRVVRISDGVVEFKYGN